MKQERIFITQWAGQTWKALCLAEYDKQRRKYWMKTGCLITADRSKDSLNKPEGLDNYSVSLPSIIDPTSEQPTGNQADVQLAELNLDSVGPVNEIRPDDTMVGPIRVKRKKCLRLY